MQAAALGGAIADLCVFVSICFLYECAVAQILLVIPSTLCVSGLPVAGSPPITQARVFLFYFGFQLSLFLCFAVVLFFGATALLLHHLVCCSVYFCALSTVCARALDAPRFCCSHNSLFFGVRVTFVESCDAVTGKAARMSARQLLRGT